MKLPHALLFSCSLAMFAGCLDVQYAGAQSAPDGGPPPPPPVPPEVQSANADPMEQLVAPIALYPDALVALILPASTSSPDIVLAQRYLQGGGDPNDVDSRSWDPSVKGLAHYPALVKWLDDNLEWTQQLGAAYVNEPDQVMAAVQRARAQARANGVLADNQQQQVVVDDNYIRIVPAQPDVIYVPAYDPEIIYLAQPPDYYPGPLITFGVGFGAGFWLSYDCDWAGHAIWVDRHAREHWRDQPHHDWRRHEWPQHAGTAPDANWRPWRPAPNRPHPSAKAVDFAHRPVVHPAPPPQAPNFRHAEPRPVAGQPPRNTRPPEGPGARPVDHGDHGRVPPAAGHPEGARPAAPVPNTNPGREPERRQVEPRPSRPASDVTVQPQPRPEHPERRPVAPVTAPSATPAPAPAHFTPPPPLPQPAPAPERRAGPPPMPHPEPHPQPHPEPHPQPQPHQEHREAPRNDHPQENRPDRDDKKPQDH